MPDRFLDALVGLGTAPSTELVIGTYVARGTDGRHTVKLWGNDFPNTPALAAAGSPIPGANVAVLHVGQSLLLLGVVGYAAMLHYVAADIVTVAAGWTARAGPNMAISGYATPPTLVTVGGHQALRFVTATGDAFDSVGLGTGDIATTLTEMTIFAVVGVTVTATYGAEVFKLNAYNSTTPGASGIVRFTIGSTSAKARDLYLHTQGGAAINQIEAPGPLSVGPAHVVELVTNHAVTTTTTTMIDGTSASQGSGYTHTLPGTLRGLDRFSIGDQSTTVPVGGLDVYEVQVYDQALPAAERTIIRDALIAAYA